MHKNEYGSIYIHLTKYYYIFSVRIKLVRIKCITCTQISNLIIRLLYKYMHQTQYHIIISDFEREN